MRGIAGRLLTAKECISDSESADTMAAGTSGSEAPSPAL